MKLEYAFHNVYTDNKYTIWSKYTFTTPNRRVGTPHGSFHFLVEPGRNACYMFH